MSNGIKIIAQGSYACFTRPEMKAERVSYDVITPSAAVGLISAIHWKPAIRWIIEEIHVLNPIRFETIKTNEITEKSSLSKAGQAMRSEDISKAVININEKRTQRSNLVLRDVAYGIKARFELTDMAGPSDNVAKHLDTIRRRLKKGQNFKQPALGLREYAADVFPVDDFPETAMAMEHRNRNLGLMLHHIDYENNSLPVFYEAAMRDGVINVAGSQVWSAAA